MPIYTNNMHRLNRQLKNALLACKIIPILIAKQLAFNCFKLSDRNRIMNVVARQNVTNENVTEQNTTAKRHPTKT